MGLPGFMEPGAENNPGNMGFGMGAPGYFDPYQSGPGIQAPQGYGGPEGGGDFTQRGFGEQAYQRMAPGFERPGMSEGFAAQQINHYGGGNIPSVSNNQQQNYDAFKASNVTAGLDPYYDRARERQTATLDNQLAARGLSTSSGGIGLISDAMKDLNAEQANREADFQLKSFGLGGQLAGGADSQSNASSQNQLGWTQGLGGLAGQADVQGMNRLNAGLGAAGNAQQLEQGRWQQLFNNEMGMAGQQSQMMGDTYGQMLSMDPYLMEQSMNMGMGLGAEALTQDQNKTAQRKEDVMDAASLGLLGGL